MFSCSPPLAQGCSKDMAQQQQDDPELFVPSELGGRCTIITLTEISSIHQDKPTEHFVMYKEISAQPSLCQSLGWSSGTALAAAGSSSALRVGSFWLLSQGETLSDLLARVSLTFSHPFFHPKESLEIPALVLTPQFILHKSPVKSCHHCLSSAFYPLCSQTPKIFPL